jgi:hypothetical protein
MTVDNTIFKAGHRYNLGRQLLHCKWWEGSSILWPIEAEYFVFCSCKNDNSEQRVWTQAAQELPINVFNGIAYTVSRIGPRIDGGYEGFAYDYILLDTIDLSEAGITTPFGGIGQSVHFPQTRLLPLFKAVKSWLLNMRVL